MKKLLSFLLSVILLLQLVPISARAETASLEPLETGVGVVLADPAGEDPAALQEELSGSDVPEGGSVILLPGDAEGEESGEYSPAGIEQGYVNFDEMYEEQPDGSYQVSGYRVSAYLYDSDWEALEGGEFQYLWFYKPDGSEYGPMSDAVPLGLAPEAWPGNRSLFSDSCYDNTGSALDFFSDSGVRALTDPLWTEDNLVPELSTEDIDVSRYGEDSGSDPFFVMLSALVRWRPDEESDWSFYCYSDLPHYFPIQVAPSFTPVFYAEAEAEQPPADCITPQDWTTAVRVYASYPGGELAYQWFRSPSGGYDGELLEGETNYSMRVTYPAESGADYYYCEVTYTFGDLEPGFWRSPIMAVRRTSAQGYSVMIRPFSIYQGQIDRSYPARGSGTMSSTPFEVVNTGDYRSYEFEDAWLHTAVGDTPTVSARLEPSYTSYSAPRLFTNCDLFTYEWYWSNSEAELGELIGSGSVTGLTEFDNQPISTGRYDLGLLNQHANIHCSPPTTEAGLHYLTLVGTVHYGEDIYTDQETVTVMVYADPCDLYSYDEDSGRLYNYTGCSDEVVVPADYHGMPVKSFYLGSGTTDYTPACVGIRKITLPEGLEAIQYNCFYKLASLQECSIPSTVTEIGKNAFYGTELPELRFASDVFPALGEKAFSHMQYLTSVTLPKNAQGTLSGTETFSYSPNLRTVMNYSSILDPDPNDDFKGTPVLTRLNRSAEDDGTLFYVLNDAGTGYIVVGFSQEKAEVTVPSAFNGLPVVAIESSAFEGNEIITSLTAEGGVLEIQDYAFYECPNLETVTLGEGLTAIGREAFCRCGRLRTLTLPEGLVTIGDRAFYAAGALETLRIPSTLTTIGDCAFEYMSSVTEVDFSAAASLQSIGVEAFAYAFFDAAPVTLPAGTLVMEKAFYFCVSIPAVTVDGCRLENAAFNWCPSIDSIQGDWIPVYADVEVGKLCYYDNFLFARCLEVTTDSSYYRRISETEYRFDPGVEYNNRITYRRSGDLACTRGYGEDADQWHGAYYLDIFATDFSIPGTLEVDGETVAVKTLEHTLFDEMRSDRWNIQVEDGVEEIDCYGYGRIASFRFPSTVKRFRNTLFYYTYGTTIFGSPYLTEIYLPASLETIPEEAFANCPNLKTVTFDPDWGTTPLSVGMFLDCPAIEEIVLPANLKEVPENCFRMCTSLRRVVFPQGLKSIGRKAFASCWSLAEIDLPASLESFDTSHYSYGTAYPSEISEAFAGCALTAVDLTGCPLLTEIPGGTFASNGELTVIRLGDGIGAIGNNAFSRSGMSGDSLSGERRVLYGKYGPEEYRPITEFRWPAGLRSIGDRAFYDCFLGLAEDDHFLLEIPESVEIIGESAFAAADHSSSTYAGLNNRKYNCISLPEGRLPAALSSLGSGAFRYTTLEEVTVPQGVTRIPDHCFSDSPLLTRVSLPDTVTEIGDWAFASSGITGDGGKYILPQGLKRIGFAAFVATANVLHWVLPAGLEYVGRRGFDFFYAGSGTLSFLNQDGALPEIQLDSGLFSVPVTVRCYENSAAHTWAKGMQAGDGGTNVTIQMLGEEDMLRLLLMKRDGSAVGASELQSVRWYDDTAEDGQVLSTETSLEGDFDPEHVYRVDVVTTDDLRYEYLVPETLSLSVFPEAEPSVTYTLDPRERVTYSFSVQGFDRYASIHKLTVSTTVGEIRRDYDKLHEAMSYDGGTRTFRLEVPRIETSLTVTMPDQIPLRLEHIQMYEAVDGVIDLGRLEPVYNPLALEYLLCFEDADSGDALDPGFDGEFTLTNKATGEDIPGIQVYRRRLTLPEDAYQSIAAGDELELNYTPAGFTGHTLAEPLIFPAADRDAEETVLRPRVHAPASCFIHANGDSSRSLHYALFNTSGEPVVTFIGALSVANLICEEYTLVIWNSITLDSIPDPDYFARSGFPEYYYIRETLFLSPGQSLQREYEAPENLSTIVFGEMTVALTADRAHISDSVVPVYLSFIAAEKDTGKEKIFTIQELSDVIGRFVEYGGAYAYVNGEPVEAEVFSGGGTFPRLVIPTTADEGTVTIYCRAEGQTLNISGITAGGVPVSGAYPSLRLPICTYEFTPPAAVTGKDSGNLQLTYNSTVAAKALIFTDGEYSGTVDLPGMGVTAFASLPYHFDTLGYSGIHTLLAVVVKGSFSGTEEDWYELVLSDDGSYEETVLASSPEYEIIYLKEPVPEPKKLVITADQGEPIEAHGVRSVETAVVDFDSKIAQKLRIVVLYWNLNRDGTLKNDYTLDYALTMENAELAEEGSVYLDVYCNESAEQPTIYTVPLTRNPLTGDFEGTLTFPGGTISPNDMPYYVFAGCSYTPAESAVELEDAYLAAQAEKAADELQAILDAAREEDELFDLDIDLDMVELLLQTDLAELPEENKQIIRDAALNMKELAEIREELSLGLSADGAALQLLLGGGLTYGTCDGLDEETLLGMGARKLETKNGTMFALIGEKTAVLYDLASDVSVSMDAEALAGALSSGGGAAGLMEEDVLRSLGATTASQAALMDSEDKYKELFEELLQFRGPLLSILDFVESIVDKLADNRIKEMKALEKQIELAQEDYDATLAMMKNLEKSGSTSGRMYQKLSKGLEKYQSLRNKTLADLQEMMASNHLGRIQTILKDVRAGLLTYSPDSHFAGKAKEAVQKLMGCAKASGKMGGVVKNIFKVGGKMMGVIGLVLDAVSLFCDYEDLCSQFERYKNVDQTISDGMDRLGYAYAKINGYCLREEVLEKHELSRDEQLAKGSGVWTRMMLDNLALYSDYVMYFSSHKLPAATTNLLNTAAALTGNVYVVAGVSGVSSLYLTTSGFVTAFNISRDDSALDEDWEDYYEHVVNPVGRQTDDEEDGKQDGRNSGKSGSSGFGAGVRTPTNPLIDPAGYVYEAVASNRVEGATLRAYYLKDGEEVYWDDADYYDEVNPQITDETGAYSWYTPIGKWKVRAEKEGYEPANSEADPAAVNGWLPVPPPQMNVYIPMVSGAAPAVESILAAPTEVRITFTKYMDAAQLAETPALVQLTQDGAAAEVLLSFADLEESPALPGVFYGRTLVLTPADGGLFRGGTAEVGIDGSLRSYAGTPLGADYRSGPVPVQAVAGEIRVLRDGALSTDLGSPRTVVVEVLDTEGRPMENARVTVSSETGKLDIGDGAVTTDAGGLAQIRLSGISVGPDTLRFASGIARAELAARVSVETAAASGQSVISTAAILSRDETCAELTARVLNNGDLPVSGELIAALYREDRFLGAALSPDLTVNPGDTAASTLTIPCDASGDVTLKLFFVDADTFVPLIPAR